MLFLRTLYLFVLLYLPALAAAAIALKRGSRDIALIGATALAAFGLNGYIVLWLWFCAARVGRLAALIIPIASALLIAYLLRDAFIRSRLRRILLPIGLSGVFSVLVLCAGFAYGGSDRPYETAWVRFSHPLPPDNAIPYIFAEGVWNQHIPKPMLGDWRSSDRPPLQSGLVLAGWRYNVRERQLSADITGFLAQSTWILALWAFLNALELEPGLIAIALAAGMVSGFVLVNTFFVWPKLLAAAFVVGAFTSLIKRKPVLCGICIALGMLAHGGSIFALIGAVLVIAVLRLRMPLRSVGLLIVTAAALYLPWLLYQKLFDPPGTRLLTMHLAGIEQIDSRPLGKVLRSAYAAKTPQQIYFNKVANLDFAKGRVEHFRQTVAELLQAGLTRNLPRAYAAAREVRVLWFFDFIPTLGFFGLGIPLLLLGVLSRFRTRYWRIAIGIWLFIVLTDVIWCLVMFGPYSTVIHQGTYATVLLAFAACCLSIWSVSRALAITVVVLQMLFTFVVYGPLGAPPQQQLDWTTVWMGCAAFAGVVALLYCMATGASAETRGLKTVH
jgi:hypothetical protein